MSSIKVDEALAVKLGTEVVSALVKFADDVDAGVYVYVDDQVIDAIYNNYQRPLDIGPDKRALNMGTWDANSFNNECGTVCCIGGWASRTIGRSLTDEEIEAANKLFYPWGSTLTWDNITPAMAAVATKNFLETGHPRWEEVTDGQDA